MTLMEKCIFDYNLVYESCIETFNQNPTGVAYKLTVCTELYDSIGPGGSLAVKLTATQCSKLLLLDNIFDYFYSVWIAKDTEFKPMIENFFTDEVVNKLT